MSSHINPDAGRLIIESTQNLDLTASQANMPAGASLYNKGGLFNAGHLYVQGTLVVNGDIITLGNSGGSLTLNSNISSDVLPDTISGINYSIGSSTKPWKAGYFERLVAGSDSALSKFTATTNLPSKSTIMLNANTDTSLVLGSAGAIHGERRTLTVIQALPSPIIVTPQSALGFTSISFSALGDTAELIWTSTNNHNGWSILSIFRANVT